MSEAKVLDDFEEAPHIELNQDGSTIDLTNWDEPANRNWSYRHIADIFPFTQKVSRGDGAVHEFDNNPADISAVTAIYRGVDMRLDDYLKESHCDGFLVVKGNDVIYENYRRMDRQDRHLCQSVSKTAVCSVVGGLAAQGLIDPEKTVDEYIPEVGSGFKGVKLQNLLDMNVALDFSEDFTDPDSDILEYEMRTGWHPDAGAQDEGILPYLCQIERDPDFNLDGTTNYLCPNTDMIACIASKVTGKPFAELFQDAIYQHIGAEADAYFSTDAKGAAIASGGLIIRLRDLARYGQMFANKGKANDGTQVIPESWMDDCLDRGRGTKYYLGDGYQYHNQITSNGKAFCHLGVAGQMIYANTETRVVVVQFSTLTSPSKGDLDIGNALYFFADAISDYLSAG